MKYLIYLESYTFIFLGTTSDIVYNSLDGCYFVYTAPTVRRILQEIMNCAFFYGTIVDDKIVRQEDVVAFIDDMHRHFMGGMIRCKHKTNLPFIPSPIFRINDLKVIHEDDENYQYDKNITKNLHEVFLFLPSRKTYPIEYYKQYPHPDKWKDEELELKEYINVVNECREYESCKISLIGETGYIFTLLKNMADISCLKDIYLDATNVSVDELLDILRRGEFKLKLAMHSPCSFDLLLADNELLSYNNRIEWQFFIYNDTDYFMLEKILKGTSYIYSIKPVFNHKNESFFKDYVAIDEGDLKEMHPNKIQIFRRKVLNENFYGKLYIYPNGNVTANMNMSVLGNIKKTTLYELICRELQTGESWTLSRDKKEPCKNCEYRYLCPSISNVELVMNKFDLCMKGNL